MPAPKYASINDYLAAEELTEYKSEYCAGDIITLAGGTISHNLISVNAHSALKTALKAKPFEVFIGNLKLYISAADALTYPDVLVIKDQPEYWQNREDIVCNATMIIEVLSDSTIDYDRGGKFEIYRQLPDLKDYILISQNKVHVEHYEKQASKQWLLTDYNFLADVLNIVQLGETLAVGDIYEQIDFEK